MKSVKKTLLKRGAYLPLMALALSGCASAENVQVIRPGDKVGIHFTCRQKSGEIAASTYKDINDSPLPKSPMFMKRTIGDPVVITAGTEETNLRETKLKSFEETIMTKMAGAVLGMRPGEKTTLDLTAERPANLPPKEQFIKIVRVRKHLKEMKMPLAKFKALAKRDPVVGQVFTIDPALPGKVVNVTGDEVLLSFAPTEKEVNLPFGRGIIREKGDHYEIDIQAVKGTLVRTGGLVGRISDVDADSITLDYGDPFGGEVLNCDVKVESVQPGNKKAADAGKIDKDVPQALNNAPGKAAMEGGRGSVPAGTIERGDLVMVDYTAALEDGAIFSTTMENTAKDLARKKVSWFREPAHYSAEEIVAGKEELVPGLGDAVLGLGAGAKKQIRLTPDKAFGLPDPKKQVQLPCSRTFPRVVRLPADEYMKRFFTFPVLNKEVDLVPYFKARVMEVTERDVALEFLAKDGATFTESYGTVTVSVAGDQITTNLKPFIGAEFPIKDETGIITATDGASFTVDTNNPLAGKSIVVDLAVVSLTKAATLHMKPIDWIEEYNKGLAEAKKDGKPLFLLLYADWCHWCQKTQSETLTDPRIERLRDKFVWMKVNSNKEKKYKKQYGQNGFPMIVLMKPDGSVLKKIDGYRDAGKLAAELKEVL